MQWLAGASSEKRRGLRSSLAKLDTWLPAGVFAMFEAKRKMSGNQAAKEWMGAHKQKKLAPLAAGGAAATLLHAALRVTANARPALRRAALFSNAALRSEWDEAVATLCDGRVLGTKKIVAAVRGWSTQYKAANTSDTGLGSLNEFMSAMEASDLALSEGDEWPATLPFAEATVKGGDAPETLSDGHTRGVQTGLLFMRNGKGPGDSPKGAWGVVWKSFCKSLGGEEGSAAGTARWEELVGWHGDVQRRHRARHAAKSAANLNAASLPPLKPMLAAGLFEP